MMNLKVVSTTNENALYVNDKFVSGECSRDYLRGVKDGIRAAGDSYEVGFYGCPMQDFPYRFDKVKKAQKQ